jgi:hypothetical protein
LGGTGLGSGAQTMAGSGMMGTGGMMGGGQQVAVRIIAAELIRDTKLIGYELFFGITFSERWHPMHSSRQEDLSLRLLLRRVKIKCLLGIRLVNEIVLKSV